jgi:hypothetical protein
MENVPHHESEHPGDRAWEPEDPMQLDAVPANGDPGVMLVCLVEEFARMGMSTAEIEALFENPFFQATHGLKQVFGHDELHRRIRAVVQRSGVMKFRVNDATHATCQPADVQKPSASGRKGKTDHA